MTLETNPKISFALKRKLAMMKWITIIALNFLLFHGVLAQTRIVSGKITDARTGAAMSGVTVNVKDGSQGVSSGQDGTYSLQGVTDQTVLVFSILGYSTQEINIGGRSVLDVTLQTSFNELEETVVVGYGRQKKRNLTGSIVSVNNEEIEKTALQDPISILQGRAAGVQITSNSGAP